MTVFARDYHKDHGKGASGKKTWAYCFTYGKVRYRKTGFRSKKDAQYAEEKRRKEVIFDGDTRIATRTVRFDILVGEYLVYRASIRAESTARTERAICNRLVRHFGGRTAESITVPDVQSWQMQRKRDGVSNRTINLELITLKGLFKHALEGGYVRTNPVAKVSRLKEVRTDKSIPTDGEFQRFLDHAESCTFGKQLVASLMVAAYTGMRPAEVFHMAWSDVDFPHSRIFVRPKAEHPTKTGRFRVVEMHSALKECLISFRQEWHLQFAGAEPPHDWVFTHPERPAERARGYRRSFDRAKKAAGLHTVTPYTLRHYFVSKAVMAGVDLFTISRWVGHTSTAMIEQVYGHLSDEHRKAQMAKIQFDSREREDPGGELIELGDQ